MTRRGSIVPALALLALGCGPPAWLPKLMSRSADQFTRALVDTLQHAPAEAAMKFLSQPAATRPGIVDSLVAIQRRIPRGPTDSLRMLSASVNIIGPAVTTLAYEMHAEGRWALIRVMLLDLADGSHQASVIDVKPLPASIESLNALRIRDASVGALIATGIVLLVLTLSLYAAAQVARSPLKRRWLWAVVAFVLVGKVKVAWTSGEVVLAPLTVELVGAGITRDAVDGPWWVNLSFPVGALIVLGRRGRAVAAARRRHDGVLSAT